MSERKKSTWLSVALAVSVVLAVTGAYVGMYYAIVVPTDIEFETAGIGGVTRTPYVAAFYSIPIDPGTADWFFGPIHNLDRQIRRDVWKD